MHSAIALVVLGLVACGLSQDVSTTLPAQTVAALKQKLLYSELSSRECIWTAVQETLVAELPSDTTWNATNTLTAVQIAVLTVPQLLDPFQGVATTSARDVRATVATQTAVNFAVFTINATGTLETYLRLAMTAAIIPYAVIISGHRNSAGVLQSDWNQAFLSWAGNGGRLIEYDSFEMYDNNLNYVVELTIRQIDSGLTPTQARDLNLFTTLALSTEFINSRKRFVARPLLDSQAFLQVMTVRPDNTVREDINATRLAQVVNSLRPTYNIVNNNTIEFPVASESQLFHASSSNKTVGPPGDLNSTAYNVCIDGTTVSWSLDPCPSTATTTTAPTTAPSSGSSLNTTNITLVVVGIVACVVAVALFTVHFKRGKSARRVYDRSATPSSSRSHVKLLEFRDSTPVEA